MSHRHTVIEPAEGLTVLIGPNNCGKSAVVTALQTLCENERGSQMFVRHGQKCARVVVETSEGSSLEWKREGSTVSYRINGRDIHRLRGGIPEDLHEHLRLTPVKAAEGSDPFQVHFSEQKQPIFLLNETPGRAATFFASASDTRLLLQMQRLAQERRKTRKKEAEILEKRIAQGAERLGLFQPVESIDKELTLLESTFRDLEERAAQVLALRKAIDASVTLSVKVTRQQQESETLAPLTTPPQLAAIDGLLRLVDNLKTAQTKKRIGEALMGGYGKVTAPPLLEVTEYVRNAIRVIGDSHRKLRTSAARTQALQALTEPASMLATEDLARQIRLLEKLSKDIQHGMRAKDELNSLVPPPEATPTDLLARTVSELERVEAARSKSSTDCEVASDGLAQAEDNLKQYVATHPTCPLCGGKLIAEQVLSGGHVHG